jgi:predicted  nucleic acid-binding Zn-ribbon protein
MLNVNVKTLSPSLQHSAVSIQHFPMLPDLESLIQLQELDSTAERLRRRMADLPAAQAVLEERLAQLSDAVTDVKERMAASQAARREIEKDLAAVQGRLSKYKEQLMEVKTNKEYHAMQTEIGTAEDLVRRQEDRLLERMEEAETHASELKAAEAALSSGRTEIDSNRRQLDADKAEIERELSETTTERAGLASRVSGPALALFESVSKHRRGLAMSEARDGLCTQCHVRLRPQVYNEVRRNDGLMQCESCSRILYFVPPSQQSVIAPPDVSDPVSSESPKSGT